MANIISQYYDVYTGLIKRLTIRRSINLMTISFVCPDWAEDLRGKAYFDLLSKHGRFFKKFRNAYNTLTFNKVDDNLIEVFHNKVPDPAPPMHVLFAVMPAHQIVVDVLLNRRLNNNVSIVDVVADTLNLVSLEHTPDESREAARSINTKESHDFWFTPERQQIMRESLKLASAVTTSWEYLVEPLQRLVGDKIPVYHLPDLHSDDIISKSMFMHNISNIINTALVKADDRWETLI